MQSEFPGVRRVVGALALLFLSACSGGGDGDSGRHIGLSTTALTFSANAPSAATPASQIVTATFGAGVTNVTALHTGAAIERVDVALNGTSAQLTVVPAAPSTLGAGAFRGTIAVTGYFCGDPTCSRLEAGQTQTVHTNYQVSPVVNDVAPKGAIAGTSANVVIRGIGFQAFNIRSLNFGSTPATALTVTSDNELTATYPALAAGSYPVTLDIPTHVGEITTTATLVVVDPITQTAQALAWPGTVGTVHSLEYDVTRAALLAATDTDGGQLVRYAYTGNAWQTPTTAVVPNLRDAALSIDTTQWIAVATTGITPVDPVTLALGTTVPPPDIEADNFLKSIAMLNTNVAVVTTGIAESKATTLYAYTVRTNELVQLAGTLNNGTARGAANGSLIALIQGDPSLTSAPPFFVASASGSISATAVTLNQNATPPALDRDGTRIVLNGTHVYDGGSALLGLLPEATSAATVSPSGNRVYTYEAADNSVRVFDISETNSGEAYAPLGSPVALAALPGAGPKMTISADGNTLFIAGAAQIVVQPTPAL